MRTCFGCCAERPELGLGGQHALLETCVVAVAAWRHAAWLRNRFDSFKPHIASNVHGLINSDSLAPEYRTVPRVEAH